MFFYYMGRSLWIMCEDFVCTAFVCAHGYRIQHTFLDLFLLLVSLHERLPGTCPAGVSFLIACSALTHPSSVHTPVLFKIFNVICMLISNPAGSKSTKKKSPFRKHMDTHGAPFRKHMDTHGHTRRLYAWLPRLPVASAHVTPLGGVAGWRSR